MILGTGLALKYSNKTQLRITMKKLAMLILVSLFCGLVYAAGVPNLPASYKSAFEFQAQDFSGMDIFFTLPAFEIKKELSNGQTFQRINLPDASTLMQDGMPELPVITTTIAIPHQGSVVIEVQNAQHSILSQYKAYPLQQGNELGRPKAFVQNIDYYSNGGAYPASAVEYSDPMILREFRIVTIQVNPFSYNAGTNELTVYDNIQLRVNFTGETGVNELPAPVQYISPSFDKIYNATIQNYSDYRDIMIAGTPPRYLIIHGSSTDAIFHNAMDNFAHWKRQKGADVDVFSTAANQAGTSNSSIQTFIRGRYNNLATRPDFVILVGDVTGSFSVPAFSYINGDTDYHYTHMNTGDILGDIFIGRISAENISQLLVMLQKIYVYEKNIDVATADWLNRMVLVGDNHPSGISTEYINKYIKEMAEEINPDYTFSEFYGPDFGSFVPGINTAINQGVGFYSFRGLIDYRPPSESSLFNGHKLLHAVNITCSTNNYVSGTSQIETFVRYGTLAAPKGAVTGIGMSTNYTHTTFNNVMHGGIFEGIFVHEMRTMGEALLRSRLYMNDMFGVSSPDNAGKFAHWCNLMGDPTMEVFTGIPGSFQISTDDAIPLGITLLGVAVTDAADLAQEGASVVLSMGQNILSRGYSDAQGNVILVLPDNMTAGEATITVSSHNFKPLQSTIDIVDLPTLVPAAIIIDDDNQGASEGNGNGIATAGEIVEIFFGLRNTGDYTISGVSGTVSSDSPWITILQGEINYPDIVGGGTRNNFTPIVIKIDPATPHLAMLRLYLTLTDSYNQSYHLSEFIPVEAAKIIFVEINVLDYENSILEPNETANLSITLKNIGATPINNVQARLYAENHLLSIVRNTALVGSMPLNHSVSSSESEPFIAWLRPETLPGTVIPMYVTLYNAAGFEQIIYFSLTVGQVTQTDPLGPDSYGYVIYDWTDLAYPEVPEYDWLEIAPQEGGAGTALPIYDAYHSSDEGDQVGAQSLAVVNLPFPFQFYGRIYYQITVCSNGFIALGHTENGEFRNFRLPGAMGPSPMIAPFWDDLATHSGSGIYTMFDRSNHSFIIEWYKLKNGKNGSSLETFQVILYDQDNYQTSLGDGPIKFQYHTFNNVDSQSGNRHGNYCSIGIEDHSGTRGLEYTFNNTYPTAAAPLSHGKALYITNVPTYHEAVNLVITDTFLDDANNIVEPGENASLGVLLKNSGNQLAIDITATLSTTDQYVTIGSATSGYFALYPGTSGVNRIPFTFTVSQDCPAGHVIQFILDLESNGINWYRQFSIQVNSAQLHYHSFFISDYESNFNGVIDPDEAVKLIINLHNSSVVDARNISVSLDSAIPNLSIANPQQTIPLIAGNQIRQLVFDLDFEGVTSDAGYLPLHFTASPFSGEAVDVNLQIPYNLADGDINLKPGFVQGLVYVISTIDPSLVTVMSSGRFVTNPNSEGSFRLYLPHGTHSVSASLPNHQSSSLNSIHIDDDTPVVSAEFTLIDLPPVENLILKVNNYTGDLQILWTPPSEPILPISAYRVYRRFDSGPFELGLQTEDASYSEFLDYDGVYQYYITAVYLGEEGTPSDILNVPYPYTGNTDPHTPGLQTALGKNYPNPFNPTTTLSFTLAEFGPASLTIYNAKGQLVRQLADSAYTAGQHYLLWDGRDTMGRPVSSGLYFYRLQTKDFSQSHKMILMK